MKFVEITLGSMSSKQPAAESCEDKFRVPKDKRMSLAYENMKELPRALTDKMDSWIECLDLSYNKVRNPKFLSRMQRLHTLILDHNLVVSSTTFPKLPNLSILWLNYNLIANIQRFIPALRESCPNLEVLSLMGNVGAKNSLHGGTSQQQDEYRRFVIGYFPNLRFLDDEPVRPIEKLRSLRTENSFLDCVINVVHSVKDSYNLTIKKNPNGIV